MSQYEQFRLDQCCRDHDDAVLGCRFPDNSPPLPVRLSGKSLGAIANKNLNNIESDGTLAGEQLKASHKEEKNYGNLLRGGFAMVIAVVV